MFWLLKACIKTDNGADVSGDNVVLDFGVFFCRHTVCFRAVFHFVYRRFFEAMSGLSTMGATIYPDLDNCSDGIILWRSLLHWFGGLGIIALAMLLLPFLRIGGMQLFQMESSDKNDKMRPRTVQVICTVAVVYVAVTALCLLCLLMTELRFLKR